MGNSWRAIIGRQEESGRWASGGVIGGIHVDRWIRGDPWLGFVWRVNEWVMVGRMEDERGRTTVVGSEGINGRDCSGERKEEQGEKIVGKFHSR